jgi:hypothetical protein
MCADIRTASPAPTDQEKDIMEQLLDHLGSSATSTVEPLKALAEGLSTIGLPGILDAVKMLEDTVGSFQSLVDGAKL